MVLKAVAAAVAAVEDGHGIHLGPLWAFADAIEAGRVVQILPGNTQEALPVSAVWAPATVLPARIRHFVRFAAGAIRSVPGLNA